MSERKRPAAQSPLIIGEMQTDAGASRGIPIMGRRRGIANTTAPIVTADRASHARLCRRRISANMTSGACSWGLGGVGGRYFGAPLSIGRIIDRVGHIDSVPFPQPSTPPSEVEDRKRKAETQTIPGANDFPVPDGQSISKRSRASEERRSFREKPRPIQVENAPLSTHATIS